MPRVKGSPKKFVKFASSAKPNTWVFIMRKVWKAPKVYILIWSSSNTQLPIRLQCVQSRGPENQRSWFIDYNIRSDGKMHLSTPIDSILLILLYLRKSQQVMPLERCLQDEEYPETARLVKCQNLKLSLVADGKGDGSFKYTSIQVQ
ncbi:ribonuclease H2 subunit B-like [Nasonia vitripennis]|uniref:Uncharacterized protein n=1 Tax=Nasonia vitripennis TaxID=7425 RepID=A0A7M7Q924_NASVI|nr:ribonuclease H2 subunit B-like [Nasonia vitripennis]